MKTRTLIMAWSSVVFAILGSVASFVMVVINGATGDLVRTGVSLVLMALNLYCVVHMLMLLDAYRANAARMREIEDKLRGKE